MVKGTVSPCNCDLSPFPDLDAITDPLYEEEISNAFASIRAQLSFSCNLDESTCYLKTSIWGRWYKSMLEHLDSEHRSWFLSLAPCTRHNNNNKNKRDREGNKESSHYVIMEKFISPSLSGNESNNKMGN